MTPLGVAVYCRISTVAEIQQHSLDSQKKYYKSYIDTTTPAMSFAAYVRILQAE